MKWCDSLGREGSKVSRSWPVWKKKRAETGEDGGETDPGKYANALSEGRDVRGVGER